MRSSLLRTAALVAIGSAVVGCRPEPRDMFPVGGRFYEYLHSGGLAIESGWRQVDLYRDDNGKRTLLARNLSADRYYPDQDCMVYTTGRLDAPRVTYAACGIMDIIDRPRPAAASRGAVRCSNR
jgi:hypothetical protein